MVTFKCEKKKLNVQREQRESPVRSTLMCPLWWTGKSQFPPYANFWPVVPVVMAKVLSDRSTSKVWNFQMIYFFQRTKHWWGFTNKNSENLPFVKRLFRIFFPYFVDIFPIHVFCTSHTWITSEGTSSQVGSYNTTLLDRSIMGSNASWLEAN